MSTPTILLVAEDRATFKLSSDRFVIADLDAARETVRAWAQRHPANLYRFDAWFKDGDGIAAPFVSVRLGRDGADR